MTEDKFFNRINMNPKNKKTGDCVIRALASCLDKSWDNIFEDLAAVAYKYKLSMDDPKCYSRYLKKHGFIECKQPRTSENKKIRAYELCSQLTSMKCDNHIIFSNLGSYHVGCIKYDYSDNSYKVFDEWNSSYECVGKYWEKII